MMSHIFIKRFLSTLDHDFPKKGISGALHLFNLNLFKGKLQ